MQKSIRCHRCADPLTVYLLGEEYCQRCRREMRERDLADAKRRARQFRAKALDRWGPVA